ncbi:MMPL family transporter [Rhodococcus sp. BP-252]|uniref:MMPL family transporter n=1 Tax=unclassified Rhodococcus (in: high G+C Gram-positive bacteria) TaxID=192944 RepID=UPI001431D966|nr:MULTISPECIES: MMPL family transporter [unclassified Rhodococcus (in: high G+C Gram-positive bacteria)]MBY6410583.1 MMPL family transporter [Rhodococcus sp. BP-320]MBY6417878.1 MMPL family transporter [Rhodococcus sp. BP-321]MBY6422873.1 MMPL family transporter [Rhodococcus sp. BP-324]MBY6425139.1 MMPL family transporter [Rhodococcus sp. BP-323]MBY6430155.1 MMPL family transporter [Rhodococcus sp. BP-322]
MTRWASFVVARKRWVLTIAVVLVALGGIWGLGVFGKLSEGGFIDPGSEAAQVSSLVSGLGQQTPDIVAIYTPPEGKTIDDIGPEVEAVLNDFQSKYTVQNVTSYWTAENPAAKELLVSNDGTKALATVTLGSNSGVTFSTFGQLPPQLEVPGVTSQFAGGSVVGVSFSTTLQSDLVRSEAIAIPITLVLLIVIFGGVVAAAVPVFVGILSVVTALTILHVLTTITEVSSFSINVASLLGLGLAIDYGLFIVSRFREEMRDGKTPADATVRTVLTAGRTIVFSGLLLICAFAGMLVFPQPVVKSLGFGAMAAVAGAAVLSLTAVPALLAILGPRINSLTWSKTASDRGDARAQKFWGGVVTRVMRKPGIVATVIVAGLLVLSAPILKVTLGEVDYTALPEHDPARVAVETLSSEFPSTGEGAVVVLRGTDGTKPQGSPIAEVTREAGEVDGIGNVQFRGSTDDVVVLQATYSEPADGRTEAESQSAAVQGLRDITPPEGTEILVGGNRALTDDGNAAIATWLPAMIAIMVISTLILLFLAFGSIVLPIKAVLMAGLSLGATFGVLTWVFQEGHGAEVLGVTPAPLEATFVVLILAVVFGLSTDYEVFLMSRMVEARAAGATTEEAVVLGAQRTGRIVTAAALILIVVTGAFTISELSIMRFLGLGMIVALIVDATIIRMLLVPSLVKLMGEANWWAPAWMKKVHDKVGIGH